MKGLLKAWAILLMSWAFPHYGQHRDVILPTVPDSFVYCFPEAEVMRIPEFGFVPLGKIPMKQLGEEQQLPSLEVYDVFMDSRRRLWIGLAFGGFLTYDGLYLRHYKELGDFNSGAVTDFLEDRRDESGFRLSIKESLFSMAKSLRVLQKTTACHPIASCASSKIAKGEYGRALMEEE